MDAARRLNSPVPSARPGNRRENSSVTANIGTFRAKQAAPLPVRPAIVVLDPVQQLQVLQVQGLQRQPPRVSRRAAWTGCSVGLVMVILLFVHRA